MSSSAEAPNEASSPPAAAPRPARRLWTWVRRLAVAAGLCGLAACGAIAGTYLYFERGLPSVEELRKYRPPQVTKVFCDDGSLCAEFFLERRTWVQVEALPAHVKNAFLAAEDADFYKHEGLDYLGMVRAGLKGLLPGHRATGASTISQQACRNLLLSNERKLSRKIREWILTPRMEKALTKDQILNLYVNQVDFGHNRYGVEEAALFYFGKHARELTVGEAAMLAGIPQLPDRINPVTNITKAKKRQRYVLTQLARHGFLPEKLVAPELDKPLVLGPRPPARVGRFYAEEVRKTLVARFGEQAVQEGGLRVDVAMNSKLQAAADEAVRAGLELVDRRQGFRGPVGHLDPAELDRLIPFIQRRVAEAGKRQPDEVLVADLFKLAEPGGPAADEEGLALKPTPEADYEQGDGVEVEPSPDDSELLVRGLALRPLKEGLRLAALVRAVDDAANVAAVDLAGRAAQIPYASVAWARPRKDGKLGPLPAKISDVLSVGDLVRVKLTRVGAGPAAPLEATLDQVPQVQGALLAIDPANRHVVAMVGGYDFNLSAFNRATQARRQPGSSFKPFLYAAALLSQRYTPLTVVNDAPEAIRDPYTGKTWKPQNYERTGFEGPMTLRQALTKSKNTVSVRLIEALTPQAAIDFAQRAGIHSPLPDNLTLALGTGEVSMLEIANAYATLQALGRYAEPLEVLRVTDAEGRVLEWHEPAFEETLPPAVAFLATSLMRSVVEEGTAVAVLELNRPAAGKTGTASEYRDAWFSGYTADYVASAWVGFDNHDSLGPGETGSKAALPIWLSFMKAAHQGLPQRDFEVPPGVTFARVDPTSGLLAGTAVPGRLEPFLVGTAPTALAPPPGQFDTADFFLGDQRGRP